MSSPHIVLIIPRGEAVRNFLYSDTLRILHDSARVTVLSVITDDRFVESFRHYTDEIIPLQQVPEKRFVGSYRALLHEAHFSWLDSAVARNARELKDANAKVGGSSFKRRILTNFADLLAYRRVLEPLTELEREITWRFRTSDEFITLFERLQPDLVFNCSHIHGAAGSLPTRTAHRLGIPTVGFIFSWDNLTSRSRIFEPYDHYLVWHQGMHDQFLSIYPRINPEQVHITGTPQFDYHFKPEYWLDRETLCAQIGIDPNRLFILYTTGVDRHFPEEHNHISFIADFLEERFPAMQMVVRTYVKGIGDGTKALASEKRPNLFFPQVKWDAQWFTPHYDDLAVYTSLLRHAVMGINPASTVSLELMMHDKPVMNIGFDPPSSALPSYLNWRRHIEFDHYKTVVESGAVMVAMTQRDMQSMIVRGVEKPNADCNKRKNFVDHVFGSTLDGKSGERVAQQLLALVS